MAHFMIVAAHSAIGTATAEILHRAGHTLSLTTRNPDTLAALTASYGAHGVLLDATDFDATDAAVGAAIAAKGPLDGIVTCAGSLLLRPAHLTSAAQYADTIAASLTTAFATVRAAAKHMTQGGSVVLISSAAALEGLSNHEAIAAAKAGIIGLTRSAAASYAGMNLRVNAVAPGLTETPLTRQITATDAGRTISENMHALGRLGTPGDVARAIAFLLDPDNGWITGQVLAVDGGLSRVRPKIKA
jgi:NAD(P)-dependent dehydrogenase (short-subunit alcohol dehydrogenase family)